MVPSSHFGHVNQIYGYMVCNAFRYGVLTSFDQTWFLQRDGGTFHISKGVHHISETPTVLHCYRCIMDMASQNPFSSPPPTSTSPSPGPSDNDQDDADYDPESSSKPKKKNKGLKASPLASIAQKMKGIGGKLMGSNLSTTLRKARLAVSLERR
ncbi:MAG: hypothetical protein J3Q66DRAFT_323893 [Benniella sp.]|nr:MAG: hypothetical protein J3Q66DRAFT_323893 [Benniella sp.]